jgi:precorrin-6B methylase 2
LLSEIEQLNRARDATIHVAIVSLDAEDNMAEICSELCRVSRKSKYIDVKGGSHDLDDALADIASLVIGGGKTTNNIPDGITVEALN